VLIGSIICIILGILYILGFGIRLIPIFWFLGVEWIVGIILIILSVLTLSTSGFINLRWKFEKDWFIFVFLGVFMFIFGGDIGSILVLIGAVLLIFK
jgi:hypothetical protein